MNAPGPHACIDGVEASGLDISPPAKPVFARIRASLFSGWRQFARSPIFWLGCACLFAPSLFDLATRGWSTEQGSHAPIIFVLIIWIFARKAPEALAAADRPPLAAALCLFVPPLALFVIAKVTGLFEVQNLAVFLTFAALLYAMLGKAAVRKLGFPLLYCLFLLPLPETVIDVGTQPIKLAISQTVVSLLSGLGYPVASSGVSIYIGQFELLIAAACAGLNSLISLSAIGSFWVYFRGDAGWWHRFWLLIAVFPVAVAANFIRVMILVLLTYYAGEAVAQGAMHEFAGMVMFVVAMVLLFTWDIILSRLIAIRGKRPYAA